MTDLCLPRMPAIWVWFNPAFRSAAIWYRCSRVSGLCFMACVFWFRFWFRSKKPATGWVRVHALSPQVSWRVAPQQSPLSLEAV